MRPGALEVVVEFGLLRSPADNARAAVGGAGEEALDFFEAFFGAQPADVDHEEVVRVSLGHVVPHLGSFEYGIEFLHRRQSRTTPSGD